MSWVYDLKDKIFTIIEYKCSQVLPDKYIGVNAYWTTEPKTLKTPKFPTVWFECLMGPETGVTFERKEINDIPVTFQVHITVKDSEDITIISKAITKAFKDLGFIVQEFPNMEIENNIYKGTLRAKRTFSKDDKL